jgi:peptidoglycan/xylan/chitin deacetylase (PgdA/CDA1 family)
MTRPLLSQREKALKMDVRQLGVRVRGRYIRTAARFLFRRPIRLKTQVPYVSFTFDDFPRSALLTGGAILKSFGIAGTYYASFGLMARQAPVGQIFLPEDLRELQQQGHELGCHTFGHCDAWKTNPADFEDSLLQNRKALNDILPGASFQTMSYPINVPRALTKRRTGRYFLCCRGGGQSFNVGTADLNCLCAFFLEKSRDAPEAVRDLIDCNRRARGWLILATHDVCASPSPFGCTPRFFEHIVRYAVNSGARIMPVVQAWKALSE